MTLELLRRAEFLSIATSILEKANQSQKETEVKKKK